MNHGLALVGHYESRKARDARIDAWAVDRSRYEGDAGLAAMRRLDPLTGSAAAYRDRCEERTRTAKADASMSLYEVRRRLCGDRVTLHRVS